MNLDDWIAEYNQAKAAIKRRLRTGRKSLNKAQAHLDSCKIWKDTHHLALLLQSNFHKLNYGYQSIQVFDWETEQEVCIMLDPNLKPAEEISKRFKQAKKQEVGLPYAKKEFIKTSVYVEHLETQVSALEAINTKEAWEEWKKVYPLPIQKQQKNKQAVPVLKPFWEYLSLKGIPIWVGKNALMNDRLTFVCANGKDCWLHVTDRPGSHVVIRSTLENLDPETVDDALQLALFHSKARTSKEAEVSLTQVKYVKRFGREKGKVQIANEKRYLVRTCQERLLRLMQTKGHQSRSSLNL